jgi:hypothetical protein
MLWRVLTILEKNYRCHSRVKQNCGGAGKGIMVVSGPDTVLGMY